MRTYSIVSAVITFTLLFPTSLFAKDCKSAGRKIFRDMGQSIEDGVNKNARKRSNDLVQASADVRMLRCVMGDDYATGTYHIDYDLIGVGMLFLDLMDDTEFNRNDLWVKFKISVYYGDEDFHLELVEASKSAREIGLHRQFR